METRILTHLEFYNSHAEYSTMVEMKTEELIDSNRLITSTVRSFIASRSLALPACNLISRACLGVRNDRRIVAFASEK